MKYSVIFAILLLTIFALVVELENQHEILVSVNRTKQLWREATADMHWLYATDELNAIALPIRDRDGWPFFSQEELEDYVWELDMMVHDMLIEEGRLE